MAQENRGKQEKVEKAPQMVAFLVEAVYDFPYVFGIFSPRFASVIR